MSAILLKLRLFPGIILLMLKEIRENLDKLEAALAITVGGQELKIRWDKAASAARAFDTDGREYPTTSGYWFAWVAFHPATGLYLAEPDG